MITFLPNLMAECIEYSLPHAVPSGFIPPLNMRPNAFRKGCKIVCYLPNASQNQNELVSEWAENTILLLMIFDRRIYLFIYFYDTKLKLKTLELLYFG